MCRASTYPLKRGLNVIPCCRGSHQQSGPPQSLLPGDLYSHDHPSRSPPPPPGLQNSSTTSSQGPGPGPGPAQSFYYNNSNFNSSNQSRTPRAMSQSQYGSPQVNVSFSMPQQQRMGHLPFASDFQQQPQQQQHFNQGVPQGIAQARNLNYSAKWDSLNHDVFSLLVFQQRMMYLNLAWSHRFWYALMCLWDRWVLLQSYSCSACTFQNPFHLKLRVDLSLLQNSNKYFKRCWNIKAPIDKRWDIVQVFLNSANG